MRKILILIVICGLTASASSSFVRAAPAEEKLLMWPYIENAAIEEQRNRRIEGLSYLVGGTAAIILPFVMTSSGSQLRDIGTSTLVPAGAFSVIYGGYTLMTDSPWMKLKKKVESRAGPEREATQWRLRREAHSREVLLERADNSRFWRYFWGSVEAGAGILIIGSSQSLSSVAMSGVLFSLSAYHFFYRQADERAFDLLDRTSVGVTPDRDFILAFQFRL